MNSRLYISLILSILSQICSSIQDPIVQITNGKILGRLATTSENKRYYAFEKIPYAAAPIGNLRFKPPQPAKNWSGILNATHSDAACIQVIIHGVGTESEDCLFLNVYTAKLPSRHSYNTLPVMVFIHGGGFMFGAGFEYRPDLFMNNGVILVTLNYRLGAFGFLSTQDDTLPGNNGLKDQVLALKWVQNNIHSFGGDPNKVIIFGESSGGGACSYHLLNQNSLGLFHGAIIQSASCLGPGMYQREPRKSAFTIGAILNSTFESNNDSKVLFEYLQNLDAEKLNRAVEQFTTDIWKPWTSLVDQGYIMAPVIEPPNPDSFLTDKMYVLLNKGKVLRVPVMMGFTSEEAILGAGDPVALRNLSRIVDAGLEVIVPKDMRIADLQSRTREGERIRKIYTGGKPFSENLGAMIRYSSDNLVTRGMLKQAELLSKVTKTYFYQFSYDGVMGNITGRFEGAETVGHAEDLKYLFCSGTDCTDTKHSREDLLTRQRLIKLWTNFAKYQNPTPSPEKNLQNVTWPFVSTVDGDFLYLNINETLQVQNHPREKSYRKWLKLYDELGFDDFDSF